MSPTELTAERSEASLGRVLIAAAQIAEWVESLGVEICREYAGQTLDLVVVLEGGRKFAADLVRAVRTSVELRVHFVQASSYGRSTVSTETVRLSGDREFQLHGAQVLVVDDIVDSGHTARALLDSLSRQGADSVRLAALLSKPDRRVVDVPVDYVGFEIPDEFVVGYGMDYGGAFRNLPDIHVLDEPR